MKRWWGWKLWDSNPVFCFFFVFLASGAENESEQQGETKSNYCMGVINTP
jgi:hypothetical protein